MLHSGQQFHPSQRSSRWPVREKKNQYFDSSALGVRVVYACSYIWGRVIDHLTVWQPVYMSSEPFVYLDEDVVLAKR